MAHDLSSFLILRLGRQATISPGMVRILFVIATLLLSVQMALAHNAFGVGDSLTSGWGLSLQAFGRLEAKKNDIRPQIINGGIAGAAADGLARLDWALTDDVGGLIVELGQ
jgi:acyl-CoA thioesterase-1